MMTMKLKQSLFSFSLLVILFYSSTTTSAQSPAAAPAAPTVAAAAPLPSSGPTDIIRILQKAGGFTTLIRLLKTTQTSNQIDSQLLTSKGSGITIFVPKDNAFSSLKPGFLNSLNDEQKTELIHFHILPTFTALTNFDTLSNPVRTQAGSDPIRLALNVTTTGSYVNITTGVVNTTIVGTVYSDNQLAVYQVDKVLLPMDFFLAKPPAPAPAPAKPKVHKMKPAESLAPPADDRSGAMSLKKGHLIGVSILVAVLATISS
ncbi:Fasciclin-like arabinogalactan protein [Quillaja saponaria]|uniref:Fasciclin-like arabinogalactan protein n=1 Tax=Quillaja saponaria TaxID=32244 RepID=A0AAD7KP50_QUISA|nr:Fasciclin-like arabinogalactan protein [Quillaja saponaria]